MKLDETFTKLVKDSLVKVCVGDLVRHFGQDIGVVIHVFKNGDVSILFADGEYQLDPEDCEVIS